MPRSLAQPTGGNDERVQVIDRAVDLLEAMADQSMSLTQLSRATGLTKGTAHRLLAGLAQRGLVMRDPQGTGYMLGPGLLSFTQGATSGLSAVAASGTRVLRALQRETGETVALHAQAGTERVCIGEIPSSHAIMYTSGVGSRAPLNVGAAGKVILAMLPEPALRRAIASLCALDPELDDVQLALDVRQTALRGVSISHGERVEGASAISVPVSSQLVPLALSILGPSHRMTGDLIPKMFTPLAAAANRLRDVYDHPTDSEANST